MKHRVLFLAAACVAAFAACKSGPPEPPFAGLLPNETATGYSKGVRTTAWGTLVADPSGKPLAGVAVRLESWKRGCVKTSPVTASCPGYLPWHATTDAAGRFVLKNVPNGEYLLVIGTDSPADLARPTIHDHITLTGGVQHLLAPTLPTIPCDEANYKIWCQGIAPSPDVTAFPRPSVEKHGDYRLATIDPTKERPCDIAFNTERAKRRLPLVVVDEWLTENSREINGYEIAAQRLPQPVPYLVELGQTVSAGGNSCSEFVAIGFSGALGQADDPRTRFASFVWLRFDNGEQAAGVGQFPLDVRLGMDAAAGPWP